MVKLYRCHPNDRVRSKVRRQAGRFDRAVGLDARTLRECRGDSPLSLCKGMERGFFVCTYPIGPSEANRRTGGQTVFSGCVSIVGGPL